MELFVFSMFERRNDFENCQNVRNVALSVENLSSHKMCLSRLLALKLNLKCVFYDIVTRFSIIKLVQISSIIRIVKCIDKNFNVEFVFRPNFRTFLFKMNENIAD